MYHAAGFERAFGTFPLKGDQLASALITALDAGYRAIDTAQMYQNEADIGAVLSSSRIKRDELLVTSKVPNNKFTEKLFIPSVEQSLTDLQLDYVDVLLLHWPPGNGDIEPSVHWLSEAKQKGLCRHVGVSNYTSKMLDKLVTISDETFVCNQVEFHPLLDQSILLKASSRIGIPLSSYCSVARGRALEDPLIIKIAERFGRTPAQIVLRWILQKGVSVNAMSTKDNNIRANFDIMDFNLSNVDMSEIDALSTQGYRIVDKELVPWAPDWD